MARKLFDGIYDRATHRVYRCGACGVMWSDPEPTPEALARTYDGYGCYADPAWITANRPGRYLALREKAAKLQRMAGTDHPKLLDVGCADGTVMGALRECGIDCYGVDVDPQSTHHAKALMGEDRVFTGELAESPFIDGSFDIVICSQTIEHVGHPFALLRAMYSCLRPGGHLDLDTPNFGGHSFRILRDRWKNFEPSSHVAMFTPHGLAGYVEAAGFEVVSVTARGSQFNQRRDRREANRTYEATRNPLLLRILQWVGRWTGHFRMGDNIKVIARKPPSTT